MDINTPNLLYSSSTISCSASGNILAYNNTLYFGFISAGLNKIFKSINSVTTDISPGLYLGKMDMALDSLGNIHIIYTDDYRELCYIIYNGTWSTPSVIVTCPPDQDHEWTRVSSPNIHIDETDKIHIAYVVNATTEQEFSPYIRSVTDASIYYRTKVGETWSAHEEFYYFPGEFGSSGITQCIMRISDTGMIAIAYAVGWSVPVIYVKRRINNIWSSQLQLATNVLDIKECKIDQDDDIYVYYMVWRGIPYNAYELGYRKLPIGSSTLDSLVYTGIASAVLICIDKDDGDNVHIIYTKLDSVSGIYNIMYSVGVNDVYSTPAILIEGTLAYDGSGYYLNSSPGMKLRSSGVGHLDIMFISSVLGAGAHKELFATTGDTTVVLPGSISSSDITTNGATLTWDGGDNLPGTTYKLRRTRNLGGAITILYTGTNLTFTDTTALDGCKYKYDVCAVIGSNESAYTPYVQVLTTNIAPVASNVYITGTASYPGTLTGVWTYTDSSSQGSSLRKWYRSDTTDINGTYSQISGATGTTYALQAIDGGKYIQFEVTPIQTKEDINMPLTVGTAVRSSAIGPVIYSPTAPSASAVTITSQAGDLNFYVGTVIRGSYTYSDINSDIESNSIFQWYRSDNGTSGWTAISAATGTCTASTTLDYTLAMADKNKYIRLGITPKNAVTPTTGVEAFSASTIKIATTPAPPVASDVIITANDVYIGTTVTGSYTYSDPNDDLEGTSVKKWYRADALNGTYTEIAGATGLTYTLQVADKDKYIKFEVTPVSL